jgi:hypothetical protein
MAFAARNEPNSRQPHNLPPAGARQQVGVYRLFLKGRSSGRCADASVQFYENGDLSRCTRNDNRLAGGLMAHFINLGCYLNILRSHPI